jgi:hypothetical protein
MAGVPPDAIPGLEGYLAVMLSCIVLRRRRAAAHRAQIAPSIVKSRPWERGFTVEGRAPNRHRGGRDVFMQNRMRDLNDIEFVRRYKVRKSTFDMMVEELRPVLEPDKSFAIRSSGSPVTTELQLSMTLRALAGTLGGARDTMSLPFSLSPPSITPVPLAADPRPRTHQHRRLLPGHHRHAPRRPRHLLRLLRKDCQGHQHRVRGCDTLPLG